MLRVPLRSMSWLDCFEFEKISHEISFSKKSKGTPGIEPGTSRSAVECSTPELYPRLLTVHLLSNMNQFFIGSFFSFQIDESLKSIQT